MKNEKIVDIQPPPKIVKNNASKPIISSPLNKNIRKDAEALKKF